MDELTVSKIFLQNPDPPLLVSPITLVTLLIFWLINWMDELILLMLSLSLALILFN